MSTSIAPPAPALSYQCLLKYKRACLLPSIPFHVCSRQGDGHMSDILDTQALRSLREAKGWDQQTLASAAGVDPSVVSRLERGLQVDLKASVLVGLAYALDI